MILACISPWLISERRRQSRKSTGLWQYQTFTSSAGPAWTSFLDCQLRAIICARNTVLFFSRILRRSFWWGHISSAVSCVHFWNGGLTESGDRERSLFTPCSWLRRRNVKKIIKIIDWVAHLPEAADPHRTAGRGSTRWIQNHWDIAKPAALFHFHAETYQGPTKLGEIETEYWKYVAQRCKLLHSGTLRALKLYFSQSSQSDYYVRTLPGCDNILKFTHN